MDGGREPLGARRVPGYGVCVDIVNNSWIILSFSGLLLACTGLVTLLLAIQLRELRRRDQLKDAAIDALRVELRALQRPVATGTDERQLRIERQLEQLRVRQERLEMQAAESQSYNQAIDWVRRGAGTEELVSKLGLSRGEAELVLALHRASAAR